MSAHALTMAAGQHTRASFCACRKNKAQTRGYVTPRLTTILIASVFVFSRACFAQTTRPAATKHLVEFGWDEPDTTFMLKHVAQMEQTPFDGTVFHITYDKPDGSPGRFGNECWGDRKFTPAELKRATDELKRTPFKKFDQNFLRFNVLPSDVDWFDDFHAVMTNACLAARVARDGKCRGVLFDIEAYDKPLWDYRKQKYASTRSWDQYAEQARDRGRSLMSAFEDGFGDNVVVFMTFAYSLPYEETNGDASKLRDVKYGLLKPFLDGMIQATRPGAKIIEGFENAYDYRDAKEFSDAGQLVHEKLPVFAADAEKYHRAVSLGFGLWLDYDWRKHGWDVTDFSKNYFTPAQFQVSVRGALETSDEFVWIYSETPRWWSENGRVKLPAKYVDAIERAKTTVDHP